MAHGKVYRHPAEKARRLENFLANLKFVLDRNSRRSSRSSNHAVGLNRFADLSNEEFRAKYLSRIPKSREMRRSKGGHSGVEESCEAPRSLDWRNKGAVTAVKDQGDCGRYLLHISLITSMRLELSNAGSAMIENSNTTCQQLKIHLHLLNPPAKEHITYFLRMAYTEKRCSN